MGDKTNMMPTVQNKKEYMHIIALST